MSNEERMRLVRRGLVADVIVLAARLALVKAAADHSVDPHQAFYATLLITAAGFLVWLPLILGVDKARKEARRSD